MTYPMVRLILVAPVLKLGVSVLKTEQLATYVLKLGVLAGLVHKFEELAAPML